MSFILSFCPLIPAVGRYPGLIGRRQYIQTIQLLFAVQLARAMLLFKVNSVDFS